MDKFIKLVKCGFVRCKSLAIALLFAFGLCSASFAQSSVTAYDIEAVKDVADKLEATITKFWTDNKESVLAVLGLIVLFGLIWLVIKIWKKVTSKAG